MDGGNGVGFDASLLEGLPLNQFNWNEWNVSRLSPLGSESLSKEGGRESTG